MIAYVRTVVFWLSAWAALPMAGPAAPAVFQNPVIAGHLADPAVIRHEGTYYLYATGEVDGDNGTRVYTSTTWWIGSAGAWYFVRASRMFGLPMCIATPPRAVFTSTTR